MFLKLALFIKTLLFVSLLIVPLLSIAENINVQSFSSAKKKLEKEVYLIEKERLTLYCKAAFDNKKNIVPPIGFKSSKHKKRSTRVEWEHVVPAENFGRNFSEWRTGHSQCVTKKGKPYKGRRCAEKINSEYRYMQADMYNLYPAIGSVNAGRSNYNFVMLANIDNSFGSCAFKIANKKAEPPEPSRGMIARAYLYMDDTYSSYSMSRQQRQLMSAWHSRYPVDRWECKRTERIKAIQGNDNNVVNESCKAAGF